MNTLPDEVNSLIYREVYGYTITELKAHFAKKERELEAKRLTPLDKNFQYFQEVVYNIHP